MRGDEAASGLCPQRTARRRRGLNGSEPVAERTRTTVAEAVDEVATKELAGKTLRERNPFTRVYRTPEGATAAREMTEKAIKRYRNERKARRRQTTPEETSNIEGQRALQSWRRWGAPALVVQITEEIAAIETALERTTAAHRRREAPQAGPQTTPPEEGWS